MSAQTHDKEMYSKEELVEFIDNLLENKILKYLGKDSRINDMEVYALMDRLHFNLYPATDPLSNRDTWTLEMLDNRTGYRKLFPIRVRI